MLAGCPTLLSPRHRLSSEASSQFQISHYPLGSMSGTQRLDLPRTFSHKEVVASRSQSSNRLATLSVEIPTEAKKNCSIRPNVRIPPPITAASQTAIWEEKKEDMFWERGRNLKRFLDHSCSEESRENRAKRKRSSGNAGASPLHESLEGKGLSLGQLGYSDFWFTETRGNPIPVLGGITGLTRTQVPFTIIDEQKSSLIPRKAVYPPLSLPSIPWIESKGDKDVYKSEEDPIKEISTSSASSETRGSPRKLKEKVPLEDEGNASHSPRPSEAVGTTEADIAQIRNLGLELVNLLVACVESISFKNLTAINQYLSRLGRLASPEGPSSIHRMVAYFTEALAIRIARMWPHVFHINIPLEIERADEDRATSFRLLNQINPIPKFLHFTANEMLLRSFEGKDRIHIIDFDIQQGLQWTGLFQCLAMRPNPPTHVRITGIGESKQDLQDTGDRLAGFAQALNLPFEYHLVVDRLEDVRLWMLHVKDGECVAVNCILQLHKVLYSSGSLRDFLGLVRSTSPNVIIMAEQEAEHNDARWEMRFSTSLKFYSAIFDSIDTSLPSYSAARIKIEEIFAWEIRNIVASEGSERIERHETFKKWKVVMEEAGFKCLGVGEKETRQNEMLLKMHSCEHYRMEKVNESEGLTLSYLDQPLYTVSSWKLLEHGGSSSNGSWGKRDSTKRDAVEDVLM